MEQGWAVRKFELPERPERERLRIEINGELTVEIDIGSSYLTIFYAGHDIQLHLNKDAYEGILGPSKLDRELAKFWINASFGNRSLLSRWTKDLVDEFEKKLARKHLLPHGFDPKSYPMNLIREKVLKRHPLDLARQVMWSYNLYRPPLTRLY